MDCSLTTGLPVVAAAVPDVAATELCEPSEEAVTMTGAVHATATATVAAAAAGGGRLGITPVKERLPPRSKVKRLFIGRGATSAGGADRCRLALTAWIQHDTTRWFQNQYGQAFIFGITYAHR
jgi:hypothetical protein